MFSYASDSPLRCSSDAQRVKSVARNRNSRLASRLIDISSEEHYLATSVVEDGAFESPAASYPKKACTAGINRHPQEVLQGTREVHTDNKVLGNWESFVLIVAELMTSNSEEGEANVCDKTK